MANIYKGTEVKFKVELTAEGFSMDNNDFDIEVVSPRGSVTGSKTGSIADNNVTSNGNGVVIFKESNSWYAIADTTDLAKGDLRVIATARIPDTNADDGIRNDVAVASLGTLVIP